jgi:hypothetical protein
MSKFDLLVDGGRVARVSTEQDVRDWLAQYREEHSYDDPGAAHVLVLERTRLAFLTGGRLLERERFFR